MSTSYAPLMLSFCGGSLLVLPALLLAWLVCTARSQRLVATLTARVSEAEKERAVAVERAAAAERRAQSLSDLVDGQLTQVQGLTERATKAETQVAAEREAHQEKLAALEAAEQRLRDSFAHLSSQALDQTSKQFLELAQERLARQQQEAQGNLALHKQEIGELVGPLREVLDQQRQSLEQIEQARQKSYGEIEAQLRRMTTDQQQLQAETANLVKALRQPQVRGRWGELQLRRVVELAGMNAHCDFAEQVHTSGPDGAQRPDLHVHLPNNRRIIVDAKVPLVAYLEAIEAPDDGARAARLKDHARQVRQHVQNLSKKNYHHHADGSHDFTVLFIPGDIFFNAALEHDHELLEYALKQSVIVATPTTLIALLKAVALGWREARLAENAQQISKVGQELYERIGKVAEHVTRLGKSLGKSVESYNAAVGSLERNLLTSARRLQELHVSNSPLPEPDLLDVAPRFFTKPELTAPDLDGFDPA